MTRNPMILTFLFILLLSQPIWALCPEEPYDRGTCDTMYVEPWLEDIPTQGEPPHFVRIPIYVTCDVINELDSITAFAIPLCYEHTEPSWYCSLSTWWNTLSINPYDPAMSRSIFRDLPDNDNPVVFNRMFSLGRDFSNRDWDTKILNLDGVSHFWLSLVPTGDPDQRWWEGSKVLLATMTFKLENDMEICIDTCTWLPSLMQLSWGTIKDDGFGWTKLPRSGTGTSIYGGCFVTSEVREIGHSDAGKPSAFSLSQNYPNPFNPVTNFEFSLSKSAHVRIDIFNVLGQRIKTLMDERMNPGVYLAEWNGIDNENNQVSSGVYFYRMQVGEFSEMKKMVLLK